jgi:myo-inositol 2-dehydrogenase / D-chiro-inositol 1-dehydrogenase
MRVALVGLGEIGLGAHLPALRRHPEVELAALADPSAQRRLLAATEAVPVVDGLAEVLADESIPAVVLATPPWVTPSLAVQALHAGRYVLIEKPVASSTAAAGAYDALGADELARIQVGLTYRHDPAIQRLRAWLDDGLLGEPLLVRAHIYDERRDPADPAHTERIRSTLEHGPPVVHEGAHVFDWLSYLLGGEPAKLDDAWALRTDPDLPGNNLIGARLRYPRGAIALVEFGWFTDALPSGQISVLGPRGHALLDGRTFRLELSTVDGTRTVEPVGERTARCFDLQTQRFVELVNGGRIRPEPDLADGLAALAVAEQIATAP